MGEFASYPTLLHNPSHSAAQSTLLCLTIYHTLLHYQPDCCTIHPTLLHSLPHCYIIYPSLLHDLPTVLHYLPYSAAQSSLSLLHSVLHSAAIHCMLIQNPLQSTAQSTSLCCNIDPLCCTIHPPLLHNPLPSAADSSPVCC